jgi:hypothetical protein
MMMTSSQSDYRIAYAKVLLTLCLTDECQLPGHCSATAACHALPTLDSTPVFCSPSAAGSQSDWSSPFCVTNSEFTASGIGEIFRVNYVGKQIIRMNK